MAVQGENACILFAHLETKQLPYTVPPFQDPKETIKEIRII